MLVCGNFQPAIVVVNIQLDELLNKRAKEPLSRMMIILQTGYPVVCYRLVFLASHQEIQASIFNYNTLHLRLQYIGPFVISMLVQREVIVLQDDYNPSINGKSLHDPLGNYHIG